MLQLFTTHLPNENPLRWLVIGLNALHYSHHNILLASRRAVALQFVPFVQCLDSLPAHFYSERKKKHSNTVRNFGEQTPVSVQHDKNLLTKVEIQTDIKTNILHVRLKQL